jgi:hypothetical protein
MNEGKKENFKDEISQEKRESEMKETKLRRGLMLTICPERSVEIPSTNSSSWNRFAKDLRPNPQTSRFLMLFVLFNHSAPTHRDNDLRAKPSDTSVNSTTQHNTTQTTQHNTTQRNTIQHNTTQHTPTPTPQHTKHKPAAHALVPKDEYLVNGISVAWGELVSKKDKPAE